MLAFIIETESLCSFNIYAICSNMRARNPILPILRSIVRIVEAHYHMDKIKIKSAK